MKSTDRQSGLLRLLTAMKPNVMVKALSGAPLLWFFLPDDGSPAATTHRIFSCQCGLEDGYIDDTVLAGGVLLIGGYTSRCGRRIRAEIGRGLVRQLGEQIAWVVGWRPRRPTRYWGYRA